ncbi:MAG: sulfatase [Cyclobacteriaceae bacterium]
MKSIQSAIALVLFACFAIGCKNQDTKQEESAQEKAPPNILFIAVDDLRPELGAYGASHINSPAIDKLASESLVFDRAYCNIPVCGASRASIMAGVRPGKHRFLGYSTRLNEDYPGITSLPMHMKNNGYTTVSNGKIYHHRDDDAEAWDELWRPSHPGEKRPRDFYKKSNLKLEAEGVTRGLPYEKANVHDTTYYDGLIARKTIEDLKKLKDNNKPFFLASGFLKPHLPFNAPTKYWDLYDSTKISLPENYSQPESTPKRAYHNFGELRHYGGVPKEGPVSDELAKKLIHGYYASVSYTDAQIGKVLDALKELELDRNTIVILWGDHGWNLGDHMMWCKHCNFESSLHVPLIIKVPGKTTGKHSSAITEFIDIYPSLSELAGLPIPEHVDGQSFVPVINGAEKVKDFAISKFFGGLTIIKDSFFYTEYYNNDDELTDRMMFDHSVDPLELNNIAEQPEHANTAQELSTLLRNNWGDDFYLNRKIKTENKN